MGKNISIYLSDSALARLDEAVRVRAERDAARGLTGRRVANRSSVIEHLIEEGLATSLPLSRETIEHYVVELARSYGATKVSLFGSYARGEARPDSDVDILLEKGDIHGMGVLDFQEELSAKLGRHVDVVTTAGASERFLTRIAKDEVVLYEAS